MTKPTSALVLGGSILAAAGLALFGTSRVPAAVPETTVAAPTSLSFDDAPPTVLPPNHPPIGRAAAGNVVPAADDEVSSLRWTVPAGWQVTDNPSSMRLATYRVPRAKGDPEDGDLSVMRAGGSKDANIERWIGQFDNAGKDTREEKTIHGARVTIVTVSGTFLGGGMVPGAKTAERSGWSLLAAIVETQGTPYFFKLTGPTATVRAARSAFDGLLGSLTPQG